MEDIPWTEPVTSSKFEDIIGLKKGSVETLSIKHLTKTGQNYGSTLMNIQLTLRDGETLFLVGKFMPPTKLQKIVFGSGTTFLKEINVYRSINKELIKLQRERGVPEEEICDPLPRYYGSQLNSANDDSLEADDNAVFLLENLTSSGYCMGDQKNGLDLLHAKVLIRSIAKFQASVVALRRLKPEVFKTVIDGKCEHDGLGPEENKKFMNFVIQHIKSFPELSPYYDRVKAINDRVCELTIKMLWSEIVEPYVSLTHNDLWVNNMMFLYDSCGNVTDVKIYDFQTLTYTSPIRDLLFFIYSSLQYELIGSSVDELTGLYYESFVSWLEKLGCCTAEFTETGFKKELDRVASTEVAHILMMLNVLCADEHEKINISDDKEFNPLVSSSEMFRKKALITLQDFDARGWL